MPLVLTLLLIKLPNIAAALTNDAMSNAAFGISPANMPISARLPSFETLIKIQAWLASAKRDKSCANDAVIRCQSATKLSV